MKETIQTEELQFAAGVRLASKRRQIVDFLKTGSPIQLAGISINDEKDALMQAGSTPS
jgi:hypothetical protein